MIEQCDFTNNDGQTVNFNTATMPLRHFVVSADIRRQEREKSQFPGIWPAKTYIGRCSIQMEGDLLFDDSSSYIAARLDMLRKILPYPATIVSQRKLGYLTVKYSGMSEACRNDVTIDGYPELPMEALYPSVTAYMITWIGFAPYFTGVSSGTYYYL